MDIIQNVFDRAAAEFSVSNLGLAGVAQETSTAREEMRVLIHT